EVLASRLEDGLDEAEGVSVRKLGGGRHAFFFCSMKSQRALTEAKAFTPTSSSSTLIPNSCSSPRTSSRASIESRPRPSPKSGASSTIVAGSMSSFKRRTIKLLTFGASSSRVIGSPSKNDYRCSSRHSSVHAPHLAGHVGGGVGDQKRDDGRDLLGLPEPRHWNPPEELGPRLVLQVRNDLRVHEAGRDRVDGDAPGRHLERERLGGGDQASVGGGVVGLPRVSRDAGNRDDVDDPSPVLVEHPAHDGLGHPEGALQIDVHHGVPVFFLEERKERVLDDAGVVDEDVGSAEIRRD